MPTKEASKTQCMGPVQAEDPGLPPPGAAAPLHPPQAWSTSSAARVSISCSPTEASCPTFPAAVDSNALKLAAARACKPTPSMLPR
jgi:hypothetical protein